MNDIDDLLISLKNADLPEFPFSDEQVRTVLENADSKNKYNKVKKGVLIMTFMISIMAFMLYLAVDSEINSSNQYQNSLATEQKITQQSTTEFKFKSSDNSFNNYNKKNVNSSEKLFGEGSYVPDSCLVINQKNVESKVFNLTNEQIAIDSKDTFTIFIPDKNELEKLFIRETNCGYVIMTENNYPINQRKVQMEQIYNSNYPKKGHKRAIQLLNSDDIQEIGIANYTGWEMDNSTGIFPIMTKLINIDKKHKNTSKFLSKASPSPIDIPELSDIVNSKFLRFIHNTLEKLDYKNAGNELKITYNKDENEYLSQYSIVLLNLDNDTTSSYWLLVYPNTENFLKLLPNRFNENSNYDLFSDFGMDYNDSEINKAINMSINNLNGECKSKINENKQDVPKTVSKINGIEKILLNNQEAKEIGIINSNENYELNIEEVYNFDLLPSDIIKILNEHYQYKIEKVALIKSNAQFNKKDPKAYFDTRIQKYQGWNYKDFSMISPACMTIKRKLATGNEIIMNHSFQNPLLMNDSMNYFLGFSDYFNVDSKGQKSNKFPNLIPVSLTDTIIVSRTKQNDSDILNVNSKENVESQKQDTLITNIDIWYVVTKEFANRLPDRYKIPLIKELDLLSNIENGSTTIDDACEVLKGAKSFLGLCDMIGDEISIIKIFPNPVTENNATIEINLKTDRKIKIEAYNSNGELIEILQDFKPFMAGNSKVELNFGNVQTGVIQISISDESNNRKTIKILKN